MLRRTAHKTKPPLSPSDPPKSAWEYYLEVTGIEDSEREREWQELLDVILVFAALFASVLSTFIVETLRTLQEDPLDSIQNILLYQTLVLQNRTVEPYVAPMFTPPPYALAVNTLFFASLGVVLVTAFLCMLVKGWIRELDRKLWEIPDLQRRAVIKELREQGLLRWRLPELISILPLFIHLSLLLFFTGLAVYLFHVHKLPAILWTFIFAIGVFVYALSILISAIDNFSPFQSLYSRALAVPYRWLYFRVKRREPHSQRAILRPDSSPADKIISGFLVPVLNKVWSVTHHQYNSVLANNLFNSILPYLDDLNIRLLGKWHPLWSYDTTSLSVKEAKYLAYGICMQRDNTDNAPFLETSPAVVEVLNQCPDPWSHLMASLLQVRLNAPAWDSWKSPIAAHEADILHAISNVDKFTTDQWRFALSSVFVLFARRKGVYGPEELPAVISVLARLLQKGLHHDHEAVGLTVSNVHANGYTDFWLYVMMSILDEGQTPAEVWVSTEGILHARDIEARASGMTRNASHMRYLLQLSRDHNLNPSLMRGCLVSILYILVSLCLRGQQEISLVNQYLEIIAEEMDLTAWNLTLSELLTNTHIASNEMSATVLCLLRGQLVDTLDDHKADRAARTILVEYDSKLSAVGGQLTSSILKVMDRVILDRSWIIRLSLQNTWLFLYAHNRTHLPYKSAIPEVWSPHCIPIASSRLDLYDSFDCLAETNLVIFFLSSPFASIACRALHWYLRIEENAVISSGVHNFAPFPTIFCKGLSIDENRESWLLLVEELVPIWNRVSVELRTRFVEAFFGYTASGEGGDEEKNLDPFEMETRANFVEAFSGYTASGEGGEEKRFDMERLVGIVRADGLGWMEDVWTTVLRPLIREVHLDRVECNWSGLSGVIHATYPESTDLKVLASALEPSTSTGMVWDEALESMPDGKDVSPLKPMEERLGDSARGLLGVLAPLLESGAGLMPATLLDRLRHSLLLSDERLRHDIESLRRINAVINSNQEG